MKRMLCLVWLAAALAAGSAMAEPTLASVFGDSMVLQRDTPISVWGKAAAEEAITVALNGTTVETKADAAGAWAVKLPAMPAGGPYELNVTGAGNPLVLKDVLLGDVWICSGQSNMGMSMQDTVRGTKEGEDEIAAANFPEIRLFTVYPTTAITPQEELANHSAWGPCTPQSVRGFTAAGYYFGRHVHQTQQVPVGLIMTAWGGTYAEAWTSKEGLAAMPEFAGRVKDAEEKLPKLEELENEFRTQAQAWESQLDALDAGFQNGAAAWSKPETPTSDWQPVELPFDFLKLAGTNPSKLGGRTWLRRDIELPDTWLGRDLVLTLGLVRETSRIWFNGTEVSRYDLPYRFWDGQQANISGALVKTGANSIVVLLTDSANMGGLFGDPASLTLRAAAPDADLAPISIAGAWLTKQGLALDKLTPRPAAPAFWPNNPNMPTVLYNAMIHPFLRMPIKGAIWYQGESNTSGAYEYRKLFPALIQDWRNSWGQGDFPFLYVQIANFGSWLPAATEPRECPWAELREAQLMTLAVPNTGMAVTIDIGDVNDIHPINKKDVGRRLGLAAQAVAYGEKLEYSGPLYRAMKVKDGKAVISFTHAAGLNVKGGELKGFEIAGADKKFVYAKAEVKGKKVVVWSDAVAEPVAVRYGWDFAPECNLYNGADLPASPFRTDEWPGVTAPRVEAAQ